MVNNCLPPAYAAELRLHYKKIIAETPALDGYAVFCPCCESSFSRWKMFRRRGRAVQCFTCASVDRHRHLWLQLLAIPGFFTSPKRILHFAPEPFFREVFRANPLFDYEDADLAPGLATHKIDITSINRPDEHFDAIICSHVLEHVENDLQGMAELRRVLKRDGTAFIITPAHADPERQTFESGLIDTPELRAQHYGHPSHCRTYGRNDFVKRLQQTGFSIDPRTVDAFGTPARIAALGISDVVYVCRKHTSA